jgi:hypothetical protein
MSVDDYLELSVMQCDVNINSSECFVCLDFDDTMSIIVLECCKQCIHERCLIEWILSKSNYNCAVCRDEMKKLKNIIPINKFLTIVNVILQQRNIPKKDICDILIDLYGTEPLVELFIDNTDKLESIPRSFPIVMYSFIILLFLLLIVYILSFINI